MNPSNMLYSDFKSYIQDLKLSTLNNTNRIHNIVEVGNLPSIIDDSFYLSYLFRKILYNYLPPIYFSIRAVVGSNSVIPFGYFTVAERKDYINAVIVSTLFPVGTRVVEITNDNRMLLSENAIGTGTELVNIKCNTITYEDAYTLQWFLNKYFQTTHNWDMYIYKEAIPVTSVASKFIVGVSLVSGNDLIS